MKKNSIIASLLATSLLFVGCSQVNKSSDIVPAKLTQREKQIASLVGEHPFVVDVTYPKDIKGTVLSYEVWESGEKTENQVFMFGGSADEEGKDSFTMVYDLSDDWDECELHLASTCARTSFDIDLENKKGVLPNAAMPSFGAEDVGDDYQVKLYPSGSYVLSALTLSYNNAMESVPVRNGDYKDFIAEIDKNNVCILVRLDTFASQEEAEKYVDASIKNKDRVSNIKIK